MKALTPFLLICLSAGLFFWYINPTYADIKSLQDKKAQLTKSVDEATSAQTLVEQLQAKMDAIPQGQVARLAEFLPNDPQNIPLFMNINALASNYGANIADIKSDDPAAMGTPDDGKQYGSLNMSFSVDMTYDKFYQFMTDLESNLRLADVTSISFTPDDKKDTYTFGVGIKAYWLK